MLGIISVKGSNPLVGKTIIIDVGHGGLDPGTTYKDIYEKDINLKISLYIKDYLIKSGANVIMIREGDYDLSTPKAYYRKKSDFDNRISLINNSDANYYISIHLNYLLDSRYKGAQVFSLESEYDNAKVMQDYLNKELKNNKPNKIITNDKYMYKRLSKPGLLIECGFLSNIDDRNKLLTKEYQKRLAFVIVKGIKKIKF